MLGNLFATFLLAFSFQQTYQYHINQTSFKYTYYSVIFIMTLNVVCIVLEWISFWNRIINQAGLFFPLLFFTP